MKFYASLIGPLRGYYLELPKEITSTVQGRLAMNTSRLSDMYFEVYTEEKTLELIDDYGGARLPMLQGVLDYKYELVFPHGHSDQS